MNTPKRIPAPFRFTAEQLEVSTWNVIDEHASMLGREIVRGYPQIRQIAIGPKGEMAFKDADGKTVTVEL